MGIVWDLLTVGIIFSFAASAHRKGFLNTAIELVGTIFSVIVALTYSKTIAVAVYSSYIKDKLVEIVYENFSALLVSGEVGTYEVEVFSQFLEEMTSGLPAFISPALVDTINQSANTLYSNFINNDAEQFAHIFTESIVTPLVLSVLQAASFCLIFGIIMVVVKLLATLVRPIKYIPLINSFNTMLGGALGIIQGVAYVFVGCSVLWLIMTATGDSLSFLNQEVIDSTYLLKHFFSSGPWFDEMLKGI